MNRIFLFVLLSFIGIGSSRASHFAGAEIRYEFNGTNYTVFLTLFKGCEPNSVSLGQMEQVHFKSASTSANFSQMLNLNSTGFDSIDIACPAKTNSCYIPTSLYPGYITATYVANVTLPAANDWVISWSSCCRIAGMTNILGGTATYCEARLNNVSAINSTPWMPNSPTYYAVANQLLHIPIHAVDPEGDSVAYEFIAPMETATMNTSYATGYSFTNPLGTGGSCQINQAKQTLDLYPTTTGKFALAYKVKDYRNGIKVGEYVREINVSVLSGSTQFTVPMPTSSSVFNIYTCPGQSNNITVTFLDSTATDSVYVSVVAPSLPGFTFSPSTNPGVGTGSATISWTTPGSVNPATLPHFYIKLRVRDNGCPKSVADYAIAVRLKPCASDSVWPGDANGDYTVNIYDPLAIAIANGQTGPSRTGATTTWSAQWCANWANNFYTNNLNMKHADCNGNGTVNSTDLAAVTANYGQWHTKGGAHPKTTGAPELYFDMTGIVLLPGAPVSIPVKLGSSVTPFNNVYGLATRIKVDGLTLTATPTLSTSTSWLGNSSNTLNFSHSTSAGVVDWAYSRTDHQNSNGQGTIAALEFVVPATANQGDIVNLSFDLPKIVDKNGIEIETFNTVDATVTVGWPVSVKDVAGLQYAAVVPNPSDRQAELKFNLHQPGKLTVKIVDMVGRAVWEHNGDFPAGDQSMSLPADLAGGLYLIHLQSDSWQEQPTVKWQKQ